MAMMIATFHVHKTVWISDMLVVPQASALQIWGMLVSRHTCALPIFFFCHKKYSVICSALYERVVCMKMHSDS